MGNGLLCGKINTPWNTKVSKATPRWAHDLRRVLGGNTSRPSCNGGCRAQGRASQTRTPPVPPPTLGSMPDLDQSLIDIFHHQERYTVVSMEATPEQSLGAEIRQAHRAVERRFSCGKTQLAAPANMPMSPVSRSKRRLSHRGRCSRASHDTGMHAIFLGEIQ